MPDQVVTQTQANFGGGLNAVTAPHALTPDEVQSSTNIDYSLEWGAASARRGSQLFGTMTISQTSTATITTTLGAIQNLFRNYGLSTGTWSDGAIPWYVMVPHGENFSGSGTSLPISLMPVGNILAGSGGTGLVPQWTQYEGYVYLANGNSPIRTNGTSTFDWLMPQADQPSVMLAQQFNVSVPFVGFAGTETYTATEGSVTGVTTNTTFGASVPVGLNTCTTGTGSRIVVISTCTITNWENPITFFTLPTGTTVSGAGTYTLGGAIDFHQGWPNGDTTGASGTYSALSTSTQRLMIGDYGTDFILLALPNQASVVTIQRDLSVGDTTFTNYWHTETTPSAINDATIDPVSAFLTAQGNSTIQIQQQALNLNRGLLPHVGQQSGIGIPPIRRSIAKTSISASISPWAVSRSDYQFIGANSAPDFSNIQAIRVIIEFNTTGQQAVIGGCVTYGGQGYPLNDQASGISYYQTYARVENGLIVAEGSPSLPSTPVNCQFAHGLLTCTVNTNTTAGITHRVFYRSGGLLADAYRVGSCTITSGTATIYDYSLPDMLIINNPSVKRFLWSQWPDPSAGTGLAGVNSVSLPWQNRVWLGVQNQLYWSWPGLPTQIQQQSQTTVSDNGDNISAIIPGQNLVIVNQNSVYEMAGSIFEGTAQNWTLTRTQAQRGCSAPLTAVSTPYGILLFGYSGISFYRQGWGIDNELSWIYDRIGDLWKGGGATDPAGLKGRIPALNNQAIFTACAAYKDEKIYLAVPTGTSTSPNTLFILDMAHQKVWMYAYPFNILSLYWDRVGNRMMAGTDRAAIVQLETGLVDAQYIVGTASSGWGSPQGIPWSWETREWSTPVDQLLENIQVENLGTATWLCDVDNTNTFTVGTFDGSAKNWNPGSLRGSLGDNINFQFFGTQSGTQDVIYELQWDSIPEAKKVTFFQTDPVATPSETYVKTWIADLNVFSGTATGSVLVDGTVVQTATFISSNSGGDIQERRAFEVALPNVTYGKNINAVYHGSTSFRHYDTKWEMEPKPFGKTTWLVTYKKAGGASQADMARFWAIDIEGQATNTLTNTWIIDGTVFSTNTLTFGVTDAGEEGAGRVRNYMDWIPFPPGGRGYLFQQEVSALTPFKVWRASLDFDRLGVKGLSRVTQNGSPSPGSGG